MLSAVENKGSKLQFVPKVSEPIVEVTRKLKALEMMQPRVSNLERKDDNLLYLQPTLEEANMLLEVIACQEGMVKIKEFHEILEDNENFLNHDKGMDAGKIEHIVFEMLSAVHALEILQPRVNDLERRGKYCLICCLHWRSKYVALI